MKRIIRAAVVGLAATVATGASAATITPTGTSISIDCVTSASQNCEGMTDGSFILSGNGNNTTVTGGTAGMLSGTSADFYDLGNSSPAVELGVLDVLLDGIVGNQLSGFNKITPANGEIPVTIGSTLAEYIVFKTGNASNDGKHFFIKLSGAGAFDVKFDKNGQNGGGLSHYTLIGERPQLSSVPLPAGAVLILTGLGGLVAMRRKKTS